MDLDHRNALAQLSARIDLLEAHRTESHRMMNLRLDLLEASIEKLVHRVAALPAPAERGTRNPELL